MAKNERIIIRGRRDLNPRSPDRQSGVLNQTKRRPRKKSQIYLDLWAQVDLNH